MSSKSPHKIWWQNVLKKSVNFTKCPQKVRKFHSFTSKMDRCSEFQEIVGKLPVMTATTGLDTKIFSALAVLEHIYLPKNIFACPNFDDPFKSLVHCQNKINKHLRYSLCKYRYYFIIFVWWVRDWVCTSKLQHVWYWCLQSNLSVKATLDVSSDESSVNLRISVKCKNYTKISVNTILRENFIKKSSFGTPSCHVFGIIGNLFENVREWCSLHAGIFCRSVE